MNGITFGGRNGIYGGSGTPEVEVGPATSQNNGSLYLRHNPSDGGAILYVSKLSDAVNMVYSWEVVLENVSLP